MITVNPRVDTLDKELIEAYRKILAPSLGHFIETGMSPDIKALWKPVKLVGPALTTATLRRAGEISPRVEEALAQGDDQQARAHAARHTPGVAAEAEGGGEGVAE